MNTESCNGAVDGEACSYSCKSGFVLSDTNHQTVVTSASSRCVKGEWEAGLECVDLNECIYNAGECENGEIGDVNDRSMCSPCFPYVVFELEALECRSQHTHS